MGNKQEESEIFVQLKPQITVGSQEWDRKAPMAEVLQWVGKGPLGRAAWERKEREFSFM